MINDGAVVLLSGGLDSTVLLYWMREHYSKVHPLYINYGSKHMQKEHAMAQKTCEILGLELHTIDFPNILTKGSALVDDSTMPSDLKDTINVVVPFRNLLMNCLAASYSESKELVFIATSPTKEDFEVFRDCRREFFDSLEKTLNLGAKYDKNYIIITPFIHMTKGEVIREGQRLNVPFENTWTCYEGKETPCMTCPSCQVRIQGFKDAGIIDPLVK